MYTSVRMPSLIYRSHATLFFRDGDLVGRRNVDGSYELFHSTSKPIVLTQAQGEKYWGKYFPNRGSETLPRLLQKALDQCPDVW